MKVLIIDDEQSVHERLEQMIPWAELGWQIIGHAYNGEEAKRITADGKPHLIITDIKMPVVDGLGYLEWLEASGIGSKAIVLSGYGDFEYIRPAFLRGAFDYLLKPVQQAELLSILGKVVEQIQRESLAMKEEIDEKAVLQTGIESMQDQLMSDIIGGSLQDENEMIIRAEQVLLQLPEQGFYMVVVRLDDLDEHLNSRYERDRSALYYAIRNVIAECLAEKGFPGEVFRNLHKSNEFLALAAAERERDLRMEDTLAALCELLPRTVRLQTKLGLGRRKTRLEHLRASYREGVKAVESQKLGGSGFASYKNLPDEASSKDIAALAEWVELEDMLELLVKTGSLRDSEALLGKLGEILSHERLMQMRGTELKQGVMRLLKVLEPLAGQDTELPVMLDNAKGCANDLKVARVRQLLGDLIGRVIDKFAADPKAKSGKQLIGAVVQYSRRNFRTVTLEEISSQFYINKNYFCSLFKNETGESYGEFLTKLRMEEAKRLLKNSELKTYEIAERVGYTDQRYFSQVFRKFTGMKPTDYRKEN
ncbi:helix-turn-helix domain-containing protein [Paenibacillus sp. M1]|uniref:Helix-turn-helix domain-containing protein n=1 Tax=Paenibacillus haidiansis TaxID=1574488 RepID=A0ABU7VR43_9BACL